MARRLFSALAGRSVLMVCIAMVGICLLVAQVTPAEVRNDGANPPRSYELGKKWLALQPELGKARMAKFEMTQAFERMKEDRSKAASDLAMAKYSIMGKQISLIMKLVCELGGAAGKGCKKAIDAAETLRLAIDCTGGRDVETCIRAAQKTAALHDPLKRAAAGSAAATEAMQGHGLKSLGEGCKLVNAPGCDVANSAREAYQLREDFRETEQLGADIDKKFERSFRIAYDKLDLIENTIRELEEESKETFAAYQSEKKNELEQKEKELSEPEKKEASGDLKKESASQAKEKGSKGKKEQWVELDDPDYPSSGSGSQGAQSNNGGGAQSSSQRQSGKTIYYDPEVWRLGDEIPGVERPADHDKPKRKPSCHFKDTRCLNPFAEGREAQNAKEAHRDKEGGVRPGWHDPAIGEGYSLPPEDQMFASTLPSDGFPSEQTSFSQDQSSEREPPSRNERPRPERYLVRCGGIFNDLQTRMQAATDLSLQVAASEGGGSVSPQIKQMMGQFPKGNGGGELVKQMIVMAGSEDRAITLTRQSISEWKGYLADLQRHQAKDYAISQQKYMTLITLGNEAVRVSEVTLEALDCYRANK